MSPIIAKQLIAVLSSLVLVLQSAVAHPGILKLQERQQIRASTDQLFGAITTTTGFNFPTSTYSFNDGDVINAGDFNNILSWIGTRNSTDTTSLSYAAFNPNLSSSTGSLSTLASTTGQLPVTKGGTATSSLILNDVILGNGTSSPQFIAPGANGNVLTSDGTTWSSQVPLLINSKLVDASNTAVSSFSSAATSTMFSITVNSSSIQTASKYQGIKVQSYFDSIGTNSAAANDALFLTGTINGQEFTSSTLELGSDVSAEIDLTLMTATGTGNWWGAMQLDLSPLTGALTANNVSTTLSISSFTYAPTSTITIALFSRPNSISANTGARIKGYTAFLLTQ